jgi:hypothetical protein
MGASGNSRANDRHRSRSSKSQARAEPRCRLPKLTVRVGDPGTSVVRVVGWLDAKLAHWARAEAGNAGIHPLPG